MLNWPYGPYSRRSVYYIFYVCMDCFSQIIRADPPIASHSVLVPLFRILFCLHETTECQRKQQGLFGFFVTSVPKYSF